MSEGQSTVRSKTPTQELSELAVTAPDGRSRTPTSRAKTPTTDPADMRSRDTARRADYMPGGAGYHPDYPHPNHRPGYYDGYGEPSHDPRDPRDPRYAGYNDPYRRGEFNNYDFNREYGRTDFPGEVPRERMTRSRTPGPDFMRGNITDEDRFLQARNRELRSKTPTAELQSYHTSNISGTPDFIPASRYANPPSPSKAHTNGGDAYMGRHPSDVVPYRQHNSSSHLQRPLSGPDLGGYPGPPAQVKGSQTYAGSLNYAAGPHKNYENLSQNYPGGYPDRGYPRKQSTSFELAEPHPANLTRIPRSDPWASDSPHSSLNRSRSPTRFDQESYSEYTVNLRRQESGFGFRIIGGTEEGSQVSNNFFPILIFFF